MNATNTRHTRSQSQFYLGLSEYCFPHWLGAINFQYCRNTYSHLKIPNLEKKAAGGKGSGSGTGFLCVPKYNCLLNPCQTWLLWQDTAQKPELHPSFTPHQEWIKTAGLWDKKKGGMLSGVYTAGNRLAQTLAPGCSLYPLWMGRELLSKSLTLSFARSVYSTGMEGTFFFFKGQSCLVINLRSHLFEVKF